MRTAVQRTYAAAATRPRPSLCCAQDYQSEWIAHIPAEAFTFNYGCGSPVMKSAIREGEQVLDLGSGVGIDCFVAAKIVGPSGRVTGVDMTDEMLERAEGYRTRVAATLGFDNLEFRKGFIESIPLPDASVDVILSNCVINLSPNKPEVFAEMRRVLRGGGRAVISDIVSDREILPEHQADEDLWGSCYTGVLPVRGFIAALREAGFIGFTRIAESPWGEKAGYRFASLTLAAFISLSRVISACIRANRRSIWGLTPWSRTMPVIAFIACNRWISAPIPPPSWRRPPTPGTSS